MADAKIGIGGAPTRATTLSSVASERKQYPIASGLLDYFPDALAAIAHVSWQGNEQHNPGQPLHWARSKSADEADTMQRHFLERGTLDKDGLRHTAKMAWRALALLQKEIEGEQVAMPSIELGTGEPGVIAHLRHRETIAGASIAYPNHHDDPAYKGYVPKDMGLQRVGGGKTPVKKQTPEELGWGPPVPRADLP